MSKAFGEQNPTQGEDAVSWQTWTDGAGNVPNIVGDVDWGKLSLGMNDGVEGRSAVYDLGSAKTRKFTITENRYGTGAEDAAIQYRTDTVSFLQDDALPAWTTYNLPFSVNCRYIQVRAITEAIDLGGKYVATDGDDGDDGSFAAPWATFAHAVTQINPGDTLYIRGGTYNERLRIEYDEGGGTAGNWVTYRNYPGETVIIDGAGITYDYRAGVINIWNSSYVRLTGLRIINAWWGGAIYCAYGDYWTIDNCTTYNSLTGGIGCWHGTNVLIHDCDVELACCPQFHPDYLESSDECIKLDNIVTGEVYNCVVHDGAGLVRVGGVPDHAVQYPEGEIANGGENYNCDDSSYIKFHDNLAYNSFRLGFGSEGWIEGCDHIEVYNNEAYHCQHGFIVGSEDGGLNDGSLIYNNIAHHCERSGFFLHLWETPVGGWTQDCLFINNTSYGNGVDYYHNPTGFGYGIWILGYRVTNIMIRNNIFCDNAIAQIEVDAAVDMDEIHVDHNLFYPFDAGEPVGTDYVSTDPKFVSETEDAEDFHLQSDSPAISAASSTDAPDDDYDGNARPNGAGYDIGAFEYYA